MVELIAFMLSSEGATNYESFPRRKPLSDYTPDYTVCQLVFDFVDCSPSCSDGQSFPTAHYIIRPVRTSGCAERKKPSSQPLATVELSKISASDLGSPGGTM